jgi:hypothetical protein
MSSPQSVRFSPESSLVFDPLVVHLQFRLLRIEKRKARRSMTLTLVLTAASRLLSSSLLAEGVDDRAIQWSPG